MRGRRIIRVELTQEAYDALRDHCRRHGFIQKDVLSSVINWFGKQPPVIQCAIQGLLGGPPEGWSLNCLPAPTKGRRRRHAPPPPEVSEPVSAPDLFNGESKL
ncbi:MAG: hypothetical protein IT442_04955 [Phycisphaeraceae bacterium]|nr:hypothetical protein [Phycisphaeraceae bacterium]